MSKFVAECPIEKCNFRGESHWRNVAKGEELSSTYIRLREKATGRGARAPKRASRSKWRE